MILRISFHQRSRLYCDVRHDRNVPQSWYGHANDFQILLGPQEEQRLETEDAPTEVGFNMTIFDGLVEFRDRHFALESEMLVDQILRSPYVLRYQKMIKNPLTSSTENVTHSSSPSNFIHPYSLNMRWSQSP